jgi:ribonuclease-3
MKLQRLAAALGHRFTDERLLQHALTHRSFGGTNNERLEFLGDSILNCVIAAHLFARFSDSNEGDLSRQRARLVRQESLAEIAQGIGLGNYLCLGEGELKSGGAKRPSILADALEAIFGAIYLDAGFDAAKAVIERLYTASIDLLDPTDSGKDAKTTLQEILQGRHLALPRYVLAQTRGEAHLQEFEVECLIPELSIRCVGLGTSRRMAEQNAARQAISEIQS